jgi:hypothetical protein
MVRRSLVQITYSPELWLLLASSTFLNPVTATVNPILAESLHQSSSLTRRNLFPSSAASNPAPTTVQPQAAGTPPSNSACIQPPITNTTWIQLGIDNYLANLPNGASLNLQVSFKVGCYPLASSWTHIHPSCLFQKALCSFSWGSRFHLWHRREVSGWPGKSLSLHSILIL